MKKEFLSIVCVLSVFISFSCSHSTSKKPDVDVPDDSEPDKIAVTSQELIMNLPATFEEFQSQANSPSRSAREAVSLENLEPIKACHYQSLIDDGGSDTAKLFFTVLKNDVNPAIEIPLNTTTSLSSIHTYSQETVDLFAPYNINPNEWFTDLGKIKVLYESEKMEIFWEVSTVGNDNQIYITPLYISGIYKDGKYLSLTTYFLSDGHPYLEKFLKTENGYLEDVATYTEHGFKPVNGKTIISNSFSKTFTLKNGEPCNYGYLDADSSCYFGSYGEVHGLFVFDKEGNVVFKEEKNSSNYTQYIPLNFLQTTKTLLKEGDDYYWDSISNENKVPKEYFWVLNEQGTESDRKQFPCLELSSSSEDDITIPADFTFVQLDYTKSAINIIKALRTEAQTIVTNNDFISQEEVQAIGTKIDTWRQE